MASKYKHTLNLPETEFGIRAKLPEKEPALLNKWEEIDLYQCLRQARAGKETYTIHDGPPYANGHIHVGHAQGHVTKDIVMRARNMMGQDARYVPGWDCHGLPIEWKIEEQVRKNNQHKSDVPTTQFRQLCREFAAHWVDVQKSEFIRMGVLGDWKNAYVTMDFQSEASILNELYKVFDAGLVYQDLRPVLWSVVEQTALAEAEAEYRDKVTRSVYASFPIHSGPSSLIGASCLIWTTTPWTLPANRAIAYKPDTPYVLIEIDGERLLLAEERLSETVSGRSYTLVEELSGEALRGTICHHPLRQDGYDFDVPLVAADFVTTEQGTGLVHLAPAYGADEFEQNKTQGWGLEVVDLLEDGGVYKPSVPLFAGRHIFKADQPIFDALSVRGYLFAVEEIAHSYPHSWRSKQPLIYRATPQWFIRMDTGLRDTALGAIEAASWIPHSGKDRITDMVTGRPDWCISRQRSWGVPIAVFVEKETGQVLRDPAVDARIVKAISEGGADVWYQGDGQQFLGDEYEAEQYRRVFDVLDVWFESGCTHAFVLDDRDDQSWPADLYLEGSDQHRGWFQSSLLESCATRGQAPFKTVVTHGFVNDERGRKMSKSEGNVISPITIAEQYGADVFRLWAASVDWKGDMRLGDEALKGAADMYRKLRNTLRFIAGNLDHAGRPQARDFESLPLLERFILHRLAHLGDQLPKAVGDFEIGAWLSNLHHFCDQDLSRLYFDIRKDALYCDSVSSKSRQDCQYTLWWLYQCLSRWLAPVLVFTAEELFSAVEGDETLSSVHLDTFPQLPGEWGSFPQEKMWNELIGVRKQFLNIMEELRSEKELTKASEALVCLKARASFAQRIDPDDLKEICGVAELVTSVARPDDHIPSDQEFKLVVARSDLATCERCRIANLPIGASTDICGRCDDAVSQDLAIAS